MDDYAQEQEKVLGVDDDLEDGDGGWVDTHHYAERSTVPTDIPGDLVSNAISEMTLGDEQAKQTATETGEDSEEGLHMFKPWYPSLP